MSNHFVRLLHSVQYYADPLRPDCTGFGTADGVSCQGGEATTACSSEALVSIQTVDRSVRLVKHYDLPVPTSMAELESKADLADMFSLEQQPAVAFTVSDSSSFSCPLPFSSGFRS